MVLVYLLHKLFVFFFLLSDNGQVLFYSRTTVSVSLSPSHTHLVGFLRHPKNTRQTHSSLLKLVSEATCSLFLKCLKI